MARPTKSEEETALAREEILTAAAEIFMDLGYKATSVEAIAERLGATKGLIYYHFSSKAEIFFEIQRLSLNQLMALITPLAESPGRPAERLEAMARAHLSMMMGKMAIQKVNVQGLEKYFLRADFRYAREVAEINRRRDEYEDLFADVIAEGIRSGDFVDLPPRLLTKPFFGILNWVLVWYRSPRIENAANTTFISDALVDYAMRGILRGGKDEPKHNDPAALFRGRLG